MIAVLLNGLWQGALIVLVAYAITALMRRDEAATRYAVWYAALTALVVVPPLTLWHPDQQLPMLEPIRIAAGTTARVATNATDLVGAWLVALWCIGCSSFLLRLGWSYMRIRAILRDASPAPEFDPLVVTSDELAMPIAAGFIAPRIVIPAQLAASLERADLERIVAHERAHIKRGDIPANLLQRIVEACLFFNPWVYVIGRALVNEREAACDDWVVLATGEADRYASCLTKLAQRGARSQTPLLTPSAIGSRRMLVGRIARLLNGKVVHVKINRPVLATTVALFGALAFVLQSANSPASANATATEHFMAHKNVPFTTCDHPAGVVTPAVPDIPDSAANDAAKSADALVTIGADGHVVTAKIVKSSGNAAVDEATLRAAEASTYSPEVEDCKAETGVYVFHVKTSKGS